MTIYNGHSALFDSSSLVQAAGVGALCSAEQHLGLNQYLKRPIARLLPDRVNDR
jgi:hypothetical protein